jgi:short-subunit dehydrogenase
MLAMVTQFPPLSLIAQWRFPPPAPRHLPAWADIWQGCAVQSNRKSPASDGPAPGHVLITGASSGIGTALTLAYAREGALLSLSGRDEQRLNEIAAAAQARGAEVAAATLDVRDRDAMAAWILAADERRPIDLLIANAGISGGTHGGPESPEQTRAVFAVNLDGVLNTVLPLVPRLIERGSGQIALISSLAGHRGFPGAPAYCGSKAAVKVWGESLRGELGPKGVKVNVVMPGFVKTQMTDVNEFPMPFMMPAERAADIIRAGLAANRARIAFPWQTSMLAWTIAMISPAILDPLLRRLPKKN